MKRDLEWYLERLPGEINFKWIGMYGGPYISLEKNDFVLGDTHVHWSDGEYPYSLNIYKDEDNRWVAHYVLEGYDGDSVCTMPECDLLADRMIKEDNEWLRFEEGIELVAKEKFSEAITSLWNWLVSKNLVSDE